MHKPGKPKSVRATKASASAQPAVDQKPKPDKTLAKSKISKIKHPKAKQVTQKTTSLKPSLKPKTSRSKQPRPSKKGPATPPTNEDIAIRAYLIAEARHQQGRSGTPESDWFEAEVQLRAEAGL